MYGSFSSIPCPLARVGVSAWTLCKLAIGLSETNVIMKLYKLNS